MTDKVPIVFIILQIEANQADMRRRVIETNGRFDKLNTRIDHLSTRIGDVEQQLNGLTERMDHMVDRLSTLETGMTEVLFRLRRMADGSADKPTA